MIVLLNIFHDNSVFRRLAYQLPNRSLQYLKAALVMQFCEASAYQITSVHFYFSRFYRILTTFPAFPFTHSWNCACFCVKIVVFCMH